MKERPLNPTVTNDVAPSMLHPAPAPTDTNTAWLIAREQLMASIAAGNQELHKLVVARGGRSYTMIAGWSG